MANDYYFSERTQGVAPAVEAALSHNFWRGVVVVIENLVASGGLAEAFPIVCPDGTMNAGTHFKKLGNALRAEVPGIKWPLDGDEQPEDMVVLDAIEFVARRVSKPTGTEYHSFYRHDHFWSFDREAAIADIASEVNRLFRRNRHPYELQADGNVRYALSPAASSLLATPLLTIDAELNRLLETSRAKIVDKDINVRRESLEALWDAWERVKTVLDPDKKAGAELLLKKATSDAAYLEVLSEEARCLTKVGNEFRIRHSETTKHAITDARQIDYFHHRMYAFIIALSGGVES